MGLRKKIFNIMVVHWKIQLLGVHEKPIKPIYFVFFGGGGGRGEGGKFVDLIDLTGGLAKKPGMMFLREVGTPMHTKS